MSVNQFKSVKNDSHYRKAGAGGRSGGFGQQRNFPGGGGGSTAPPLVNNPPPVSANRSFTKTNNGQGVQSRVTAGPVQAAVARAPLPNGSHSQSTSHAPAVTLKPNDASTQRSTWPAPNAPPSQSSSVISASTTTPTTPAKGDGAKGISLQFGSLSPGFMHGMQVPARTTSAPPNLDEQKQAQRVASKGASTIPIASAPKPQLPRKDAASVPLHNSREINADMKVKRDAPVTSVPQASQAQKPAVLLPLPKVSMQMPYTLPSAPMQFGGPNPQMQPQVGGPNPQMQPQGKPATPLPIPMQIPVQMGNSSPMQQQLFMQGLQHPMIQSQGIMHMSQGIGFNPQMSQHPHQLGSLGMNLPPPQFAPQQASKYSSPHKTVKITHPETREELRLDKWSDAHGDGTSASKTLHNAPPQHYTSGHPISNHSKPYSAAPSYVVAPSGSLPLNSAQLNPVSQQSSGFNYPVSKVPHTVSLVNHSAPNSVPVIGTVALGTVESSNLDSSRVTQNVVLSPPVSVPIKPAAHSSTEKGMDSKPVEQGEKQRASRLAEVMGSSHSRKDYQMKPDNSSHSNLGFEQLKPSSASVGGNATDVTASSMHADPRVESFKVNINGKKQDVVVSSHSAKENCKKPVLKGHAQMPHQVGIHASSAPGLSQAVEGGDDSSTAVSSLSVESKNDLAESRAGRGTGDACIEQLSAVTPAPVDDSSCGAGVIPDSPACSASDVVGATVGVGTGLDCRTELQNLPPRVEASGAENHAEKTNICALGNKMHLETSFAEQCIHAVSDDGTTETSGTSLETAECMNGNEAVTEVYSSGHESQVISAHLEVSGSNSRPGGEGMETRQPRSSSGSVSNSIKAPVESNKTKSTLLRGKKKIKQVLQQADAQGTTSDLYGAYKGPEEKKERNSSVEHIELPSGDNLKPVSDGRNGEDASIKEKVDESKAEPDDWEEAADVSTPKLLSSNKDHDLIRHQGEEDGTAKKYSRDFLLTFSEQYTDLPEDFGITPAFADILTRPKSSSSHVVDRECPSPGRIIDRTSRGPKVDQRGSGMMDADRWNKQPGPFPSSRDMDPGSGPMSMGFRPGQGGNHGVLRNTRAQQSVQYPILSGPAQYMHRSNSDADRWRNTNFKGLMPPPQTPMPSMHKAEKKYEVGKVTDEEQVKQRKLKGILNKLTPQNFDKLFAQVKEVNIDNVITLSGVISQIFEKALMEPTFCEMYSNFCYQLSLTLPELTIDDEKVTFKRLLLNKCQEEFERGEGEEEEASEVDNQDETQLSDKEREEKRLKARRHMLGNIRLIGELYKKRMLTERIMHGCIQKLLRPNSDEEDIESLCKLMSTIGEMIDHAKSKEHMDYYFGMMTELSNNMNLSSRVRFMLKDAIDLRKNKWQQRRKVEGPKKIDDVHRDAAQERQAQATRLNRAPSMGSGMRRGQHVDFGPRGSSTLSSPVGQMGSFCGSPQVRSYGMQGMRNNERNSFESRTISVPLPQRSSSDNSITLGPQGGLARGMSSRGQPFADNSLSHGEARRNAGGMNGFSSMSERAAFNSREDSHPRYTSPERFGGSKLSLLDPAATSNRDHANVDRNLGSVIPTSPPRRIQGSLTDQNLSSEKVWPEEQLRKKSIAAIREFYSAKDEKEVVMCVRELNAPSLYPSVISIWVTDSFDRKDLERDLLNKLMVDLSKPRDGRLFISEQLIKGFEAVLANLEDTVNDAPKAPDYLGRLFASLILGNVVSLREIGVLIYEGGEKPGHLREEGLAGDILGSILENVKSEKGDAAVKDACTSSKLRLEDFKPPDPLRSRKLEQFI